MPVFEGAESWTIAGGGSSIVSPHGTTSFGGFLSHGATPSHPAMNRTVPV